MKRTVRLLGIDGGFAKIGYCVADYHPADRILLPLELGLVKTDKLASFATRACDDNILRAQDIARRLGALLRYPAKTGAVTVGAVCSEAMSYPRNSTSAAKVSLTWGVLATLCELHSLPIVQAAPQAVKKGLTGRKDASKEDIIQILQAKYPQNPAVIRASEDICKTDQEHPFDALASILCCVDSDVLRGVLRVKG